MIDIRPDLLQAKGLSPADVVNAVSLQNLILPSGTSKIGQFEYDVDLNSSPTRVAGNQRPADQGGQQHHDLYPRCRERSRRLFAANQHRAARRRPRRFDDHHEGRPDLHASKS